MTWSVQSPLRTRLPSCSDQVRWVMRGLLSPTPPRVARSRELQPSGRTPPPSADVPRLDQRLRPVELAIARSRGAPGIRAEVALVERLGGGLVADVTGQTHPV